MKIAFIGCGNMGEAILAGVHEKYTCLLCEPRIERQIELKKKYQVSFGMIIDAVKSADVVVLAVKPQDLPDVLAEMSVLKLQKKLVVSIAAGVTTASIEKKLGGSVRVVRVMPNLPAMVAYGVSGVCQGKKATVKDIKLTQDIFNATGTTLVVPEKMMDALTAVSGSGPAYVFLMVESWMKAACALGFSQKEARVLVYQTLAGSTKMLLESNDAPEDFRARVTSKGGTTQAAMDVFSSKDISSIFAAALKAARDRAKQLSN